MMFDLLCLKLIRCGLDDNEVGKFILHYTVLYISETMPSIVKVYDILYYREQIVMPQYSIIGVRIRVLITTWQEEAIERSRMDETASIHFT